MAGLPHGVLGGIPVGDLPSPPPCGWSRGFMTTPRTSGRRPMWRDPAGLPRVWVFWSGGRGLRGRGGLAEVLVLVIEVADLADRGHALDAHPADLAGRQPHLGDIAFLREEL